MDVVITTDEQIGQLGADLFADALAESRREGRGPVLGLATGASPEPVYQEVLRRVRSHELDLSAATVFTLDEYVGLSPGHPASYRHEILTRFTDPAGIPRQNVRTPAAHEEDVHEAARRYDQELADSGGVDLQILGVGSNGHIAFNEPASALTSRTRVLALTEQTRRDNARFFDGQLDRVPQHCITQGLGTILEARRIVLIAQGSGKSRAVRELVEGAVSARWPATVLQLHQHVTVLLDEAAAGELELVDYYRHAWDSRPADQ